MAAALRLLLRGRAGAPSAPSLALLQPLLPRPYSKLTAAPVPSPSLLRRTSGEGCSALLPVPRKPTDRGREATQRPIQASSPLLAVTAASNLLGRQRVQVQPSRPQVPSLIRHYSSKLSSPLVAVSAASNLLGRQRVQIQTSPPQGCALRLPQQPIDPQTCQCLKQAESLIEASNDSVKQLALARKGMKTCQKASDLLGSGVDDDKAFAMFEKGLDDALNALAVYEKDLDILAKALGGTKELQGLEQHQMTCKRIKNKLEATRQELKELYRSRETRRTLEKILKWLNFATVALEAFVLLLLLLMLWGYI